MTKRLGIWQLPAIPFSLFIVSLLASSCVTAADPPSSVPFLRTHRFINVPEPSPELSGLGQGTRPLRYSPGSGLALLARSGDTLRFLYVTDRGPNFDPGAALAASLPAERVAKTKVFPLPEFSPRFGVIEWDRSKATAQVFSSQALKFGDRECSGRPPVLDGQEGEQGWDPSGKVLSNDANGIDPEAIARLDDEFVYISEEYRPSILKVKQSNGNVVEWLTPGKGLPDVFAKRRLNRGFEAMTVTPGGALVALLQSTIELGGERKGKPGTQTKDAFFIRGFKKHGATVRQFAYPLDDRFQSRSEAKIGDMVALDEERFIVIIQGKLAGGGTAAFLQLLDLRQSCDPSDTRLLDGRELEFASTREEFGVRCRPAAVRDLVNLADVGWKHQKTEGIALVDESSVAVVNDNDFGVGDDGPDALTQLLYLEFDRKLRDLP